MSIIGQSITRVDAEAKVRGQALYPGDVYLPDMLHMKVKFALRPHARVVKIDTSKAEALPGVILVLTARDVPVNEYGLGMYDQPVLCGPGGVKEYTDRVRFEGDQVALVIAEDEETAAKGRDLVDVEYEDLPGVYDPIEAMKDGAPLLHPDKGSNIFTRYRIRKGDIEEGFKKADVIVEGEYRTPAQEHAFLQPEAGVAYYDDQGRITVIVGGQWTHKDRDQIAHALNIPADQVRVIYPAIGGAFGGREDMSVQIILALAVMRLKEKGIDRPVKIVWTREESIIGHNKRHPFIFQTRWGATRDGKIVAAKVTVIADGGAYAYTTPKVLGNANLMCTGPYEIPNVWVDSFGVYTNNIPNGAFRGFGGPQSSFEAEMQVSKLAEKLGMDPVEFRMGNLLDEGALLSVGTPLPRGVSIKKVVQKCAETAGWTQTASGWQAPKVDAINGKWTGIGLACAFKNVGFSFGAPEQCTATIELHGEAEIDRVILKHSGAEVGQGSHTVFVQMAAEALGVPVDRIELVASDTAFSENSGSVSASRMTFMAGNSIRGAAQEALEKWEAEERPAISTYTYRPPKTSMYDPETGKSEPNFAYGYVAEAVKVSVDPETGEITLEDIVCADDVGKAINPQQVEGQIEGAIVQAAGYALLENFIQEQGITKTRTLSTYLIPTVLDIPKRVKPVVLEYADPIGPWGARGMGEMPYMPLAPAVITAVKNATGKWFDEFPLTPEKVLRGLGKIP